MRLQWSSKTQSSAQWHRLAASLAGWPPRGGAWGLRANAGQGTRPGGWLVPIPCLVMGWSCPDAASKKPTQLVPRPWQGLLMRNGIRRPWCCCFSFEKQACTSRPEPPWMSSKLRPTGWGAPAVPLEPGEATPACPSCSSAFPRPLPCSPCLLLVALSKALPPPFSPGLPGFRKAEFRLPRTSARFCYL